MLPPPHSQAVDALLAGGQPGGQLREKTSDGSIQKATVMPQRPGVVARHTSQARGGRRGSGAGVRPLGNYESMSVRVNSLDPGHIPVRDIV